MSTRTTSAEIADYVARVRAALADVPEDEREDLIDDLESHLAEVADEDEGSLESRLGPPEHYAAELRASGGLPPASAKPGVGHRVRQGVRGLAEHPRMRPPLQFLPELRPGWWVVRGVVAAGVGGVALGGSTLAYVVAGCIAVPASVWLGRRHREAVGRWVNLAASAIAAVTFVAVAVQWSSRSEAFPSPEVTSYVGVRSATGLDGLVTNIYPYSRDGRPLKDVLLYDQNGNPIVLGGPIDFRELGIAVQYPLAVDGQVIQHAYPLRQYRLEKGGSYPPKVRPVRPPTVSVPPSPAPTARTPTATPSPR